MRHGGVGIEDAKHDSQSDGNTISGERYFEWFDWDGVQDEKYVNCRRVPSRDYWGQWTLTRKPVEPEQPPTAPTGPRSPRGSSLSADLILTGEPGPDHAPSKARKSVISSRSGMPVLRDARGVIFTMTLGNADFVAAVASQGECTNAGGRVTCRLGLLGKTQTVNVELRIVPRDAGVVRITSRVHSVVPDPIMVNNVENVAVRVHAR